MINGDKMEVEGLPPVVGACPKVLILGAFPGKESLRQKEYYAHPRNLFWQMLDRVCGASRNKGYDGRLAVLKNSGIALWDVLKSCTRDGSMDAQIRNGFFTANDLRTFLDRYGFSVVMFNGKKAAELFQKKAAPTDFPALPRLLVLPSTSPANMAIPRDEKVARWLEIKKYL